MHAVHLPPRDLWRSAALAALLTLAFLALLFAASGSLSSDGGSQISTPQTEFAVPQAAPPAAQPAPAPDASWLEPLATPKPLAGAVRSD
jgi:hypothetical protein